jgi:hypothetical protein
MGNQVLNVVTSLAGGLHWSVGLFSIVMQARRRAKPSICSWLQLPLVGIRCDSYLRIGIFSHGGVQPKHRCRTHRVSPNSSRGATKCSTCAVLLPGFFLQACGLYSFHIGSNVGPIAGTVTDNNGASISRCDRHRHIGSNRGDRTGQSTQREAFASGPEPWCVWVAVGRVQ